MEKNKEYEMTPHERGVRTKRQQDDLRIIEKQEYVSVVEEAFTLTPEELEKHIEEKKAEIIEQVKAYVEEKKIKRISYAKLYEIMSSGNSYNRTKYSAYELSIAFEVYKSITSDLTEANPRHSPSKQNFCAFVGISKETYDRYKENYDDPQLVEVINRIDDYITDVALTQAQHKVIDPTTTIFRMKTEHGYVEQKEFIGIQQNFGVDANDIKQRLEAVKGKTNK